MTPISKELEKQIKQDAQAVRNRVCSKEFTEYQQGLSDGVIVGYEAGATDYAHYKELWEQAKKALEEQAAYLQKKIKSYAGLLPQVEERRLKATKEEDWYEEKECKVLITVWGTNVRQWTETLTGIEALLASWKEEGKDQNDKTIDNAQPEPENKP